MSIDARFVVKIQAVGACAHAGLDARSTARALKLSRWTVRHLWSVAGTPGIRFGVRSASVEQVEREVRSAWL
ncbi:hypothetical protein GOEFS_119_00300 [Gordonia effusa NBRC 100432]|uniref:Transposase n=1 Tax=Gordonia effusa NBRC 100432 TaxID=1077974 RepID=H0R639_9ACTN|nr:hypothetical protein GOEFS_119_00300 [Gordonia effusa NBRC 100432]